MFEKVLNKWFIRGIEAGQKYARKWLEDNPSYSVYDGPEQSEELRERAFIIVDAVLSNDKLLIEMRRDAGFKDKGRREYKIIPLDIKREELLTNLEKIKSFFIKGFAEGWNDYLGVGIDVAKLFEMRTGLDF